MIKDIKPSPYPKNLTVAFIVSMISIFLLWPGTKGYQGISASKYQLFLILAGGYVISMFVLGLELVVMGQAKFPKLRELFEKSSWIQRCFVLFLLFTTISALVSAYWPDTIVGMSRKEGLLTIALYVLCFLLISIFGEWKQIYLYVLSITVSLFCLLSILQMCGFNPFYLYPSGYNYFDAGVAYSGAYLGTMGNVGFVAAFLCIAIPLFLFSIILMKGKMRWFLLIPLLLSMIVLILMKVAAGYMGLFIGIGLAIPLVCKAKGRSVKIPTIITLCVFFTVIVGLFFIDFGSGTLHEIHRILNGHWDGAYGSGRLYIWKETLKLVPDGFWLGGGPDTLGIRLDASFSRYSDEMNLMIIAATDAAHNEYLNILACQGMLAVASYLAALGFIAIKVVKSVAIKKSVCIIGISVLCYCIQAFFSISMFITAPYFWIMLGLLEHELDRRKMV